MGSSSRSRGRVGPGGSRMSGRRYWSEWARYGVTRIELRLAGDSAIPAARTAGRPAVPSRRSSSYSDRPASSGSSFRAYRTPWATRKRTRRRDGPTGSSRKARSSPDQSASGCSHGSSTSDVAGSRRRRRGKLETEESRTGSLRSESLAEIGGDRRVVAEVLVQSACLRAVVTGGHFGESSTQLTTDPFRLTHQQMTDAAVPDARFDDEGHHPQDAIRMLEPGQGGDRDEAEDLALVVGDDDLGMR